MSKIDPKPAFSKSDLLKARQFMEFRRANNICVKCGEKYSPAHSCPNNTAGTIHMMENATIDGDAFLSDDLLE
jgi:hypothetical protein